MIAVKNICNCINSDVAGNLAGQFRRDSKNEEKQNTNMSIRLKS
jgi:hypothetical protein